MKMTSAINKKAWAIRKEAAAKFNCPVKEISWKECLTLARKVKTEIKKVSKKKSENKKPSIVNYVYDVINQNGPISSAEIIKKAALNFPERKEASLQNYIRQMLSGSTRPIHIEKVLNIELVYDKKGRWIDRQFQVKR